MVYSPSYYRRLYDRDDFHTSITIYDSDPVVTRVYDADAVYADTVVVGTPTVSETYYTTIPDTGTPISESSAPVTGATTVIQPTTEYVEPAGTTVVEPDVGTPEPEGVPTEAEQESEAPALVGQGNDAFAAGLFEDARQLYARAMLADNDDGFAKLFYCLGNFATGDYEIAVSALRAALLEAPELIDNPIDLRPIYANADVLATHMAGLSVQVAEHPDNPGLAFLLGYLRYATGEPRQAIEILQPLAGAESDDTLAVLVRDAATRVLSPVETAEADAPSTP